MELGSASPTSGRWRRCSEPGKGRVRASIRPSTTSRTSSRSPSVMSASRSSRTRSAHVIPRPASDARRDGLLRVPTPGSIEIVMAQPTGLAEIYEGAVVGRWHGRDRRAFDVDRCDGDGEGGHDHRADVLGDRRRPALHVPHGGRRPAAPAPPKCPPPPGRNVAYDPATGELVAVDRLRYISEGEYPSRSVVNTLHTESAGPVPRGGETFSEPPTFAES